MTLFSELYGWRAGALEEIAQRTGQALGVTFELHDSDYWGGDYFLWRGEGAKLTIQRNFRDDEGYLVEEAFASHPVISFATRLGDDRRRSLQAVPGVELLRSTELD